MNSIYAPQPNDPLSLSQQGQQISNGNWTRAALARVREMMTKSPGSISIAPWLSVRNGARAVEFYKSAFGANE